MQFYLCGDTDIYMKAVRMELAPVQAFSPL